MSVQEVMSEIETLRNLKNDAILDLKEYYVVEEENHVYVITEILYGGAVLDASPLIQRMAFQRNAARCCHFDNDCTSLGNLKREHAVCLCNHSNRGGRQVLDDQPLVLLLVLVGNDVQAVQAGKVL